MLCDEGRSCQLDEVGHLSEQSDDVRVLRDEGRSCQLDEVEHLDEQSDDGRQSMLSAEQHRP